MGRLCVALITVAGTLCLVVLRVPAAGAMSLTQHPFRCGASGCTASAATTLVAGPAGRVLVSGAEGNAHVYSEVTLGSSATITPGPAGSPAYRLALGPDGNPWALSHLGPNAAVLDVSPRGPVTQHVYPSLEVQPLALAAGLGAAWVVTNRGVDRIGADGQLTPLTLPGTFPLHERAREIVAGPSESMWFTDYDGAIGQITAAGSVFEYSSEPEPLDAVRANPQPTGIAAGPDGAIWYTDANHARIGRIAPSGAVQEFQIPNHSPPYALANGPIPEGIAAGPEGAYMYFTDPGDNSIGRVSMSGEVTEYPIPSVAAVGPSEITALGSELVFDEANVAALGSIDPAASPGEAPLVTPPTTSTIAASLRSQLTAAIALANTTFLRSRHGFAMAFTPPEAGTVVMTWTAEPPRAPHPRTRPAAAVVVATGRATFDLPEARPIGVTVTAAGARLLRRSKRRARPRLTAQATFSGYWAGPIEVSARQQLAR
jgi:virginiamycin B lyase